MYAIYSIYDQKKFSLSTLSIDPSMYAPTPSDFSSLPRHSRSIFVTQELARGCFLGCFVDLLCTINELVLPGIKGEKGGKFKREVGERVRVGTREHTLAQMPLTLVSSVVGASLRPIRRAPWSPMSVCTCLSGSESR